MKEFTWWNLIPQNIDPSLFTIGGPSVFTFGTEQGGFQLRYYGLMYIFAIITTVLVVRWLSKKEKLPFTLPQFEELLFAAVLGVIIGGRLGYVLFYNLAEYLRDPLSIIWPFSKSGEFIGFQGMSFHGGLVGAVLGLFIYGKKININFYETLNIIAYAFPLGYTWGRIGNFLNNELFGRITDAPIGMLFKGQQQLRHPSQLYEALLEGALLFVALHFLRKNKLFKNKMPGLYLIGYGVGRFIVEFFREPDSHLGFIFLNLSMGQLLCFAMIFAGAGIMAFQFITESKEPVIEKKTTKPRKRKKK